jgi:hypothetical protein
MESLRKATVRHEEESLNAMLSAVLEMALRPRTAVTV